MGNASLLVNTTGTTWVDISDYVMDIGNFDQIFNNYDHSLRDTSTNLTLMDDCPSSCYAFRMRIKIRQDSKTLFVGFMNKIQPPKEDDKTVKVEIMSHIHWLFYYDFRDLARLTLQGSGDQFYSSTKDKLYDMGTSYGEIMKAYYGYGTNNIMEAIWEYYTGYPLKINFSEVISYTHYVIAKDPLFSFGLDIGYTVRDINNYRNPNKIVDLYNFLFSYGVYVTWNCDLEQYECVNTSVASNEFAVPLEAKIYEIPNYETAISMKKEIKVIANWCSGFDCYIDGLSVPPQDVDSERIAITNENSGNTVEYNSTNFFYFEELPTVVDPLVYPAWSGLVNRFKGETNKPNITTKSYLTDYIYDLMGNANVEGSTVGKYQYKNIASCESILKKGRYYSIIELFNWEEV